ncbi:MAG TPA: hypothetical protein VFZ14_04820 [Burkholderiales bacterium]|nr:hypothetical protein [Burkholderiales bacterium]
MKWAAQFVIAAAAAATMMAAAMDTVAPAAKREIIPGSELMTHQERERYRERMRREKTPEGQTAVREEHLRQVRERARLRGLRLAEPAASERDRK